MIDRKRLVSLGGVFALTAALILKDRIPVWTETVLVAIGSFSIMAFIALLGLSKTEQRWMKVSRSLKLSMALLIAGAVGSSAGLVLNQLYASSLAAVLLISAGIATFMLGILALVMSFAGVAWNENTKT